MTSDDLVLLERHDNGVCVLTLNRPPMNPLSSAVLQRITELAQQLAVDAAVKAVVITGSDRAFAAGADVNEFELTESGARVVAANFRAACDAIAAIPRPVIAAVQGFALGGGLELAMACDIRVGGENTRVGQPEILLGIIPGGGGTQRLARIVGASRAKELIWTGRQVKAPEALAIGLLDEVVANDAVVARALELGAQLSAGPSAAIGLAKRAINEGLNLDLAAGLDLEADCFAGSFETEDAKSGVASFVEHGPGKATFTGH